MSGHAAAHTLGLQLHILQASTDPDLMDLSNVGPTTGRRTHHRPRSLLRCPQRTARCSDCAARGAHDLPISPLRRWRRSDELRSSNSDELNRATAAAQFVQAGLTEIWRYALLSPKHQVKPSHRAGRLPGAGVANSWRSTGPAVEQLPAPKFPQLSRSRLILGRVVLLFGPASSSVLSLGFHGGQSSIECSNPCGDSRFLSYSL